MGLVAVGHLLNEILEEPGREHDKVGRWLFRSATGFLQAASRTCAVVSRCLHRLASLDANPCHPCQSPSKL